MTKEEIIKRKRMAYQLKIIEAMGWREDEIKFGQ